MPPSIRWTKIKTAALGGVLGRLHIDLNHDIRRSLIVAGTHRSGATWLAKLINRQLRYRFLFEPIRHAKDEKTSSYARRYLRPGTEDPYLEETLDNLLRGTDPTPHVNRKNTTFLCRGRLLKDASSSLLLNWVRSRFPMVPIVYIVRSPLLVVSSCLHRRWLSPVPAQHWLSQDQLMADHLEPFTSVISRATTPVEQYALEWCISNYVPMMQFGPGEWQPVRYEDLVRDPVSEMQKIFGYLGAPYDESIAARASAPSHTAEEAIGTERDMLSKWTSTLSHDDIRSIARLVGEFDLRSGFEHSFKRG